MRGVVLLALGFDCLHVYAWYTELVPASQSLVYESRKRKKTNEKRESDS
jgi:hypothetical protein